MIKKIELKIMQFYESMLFIGAMNYYNILNLWKEWFKAWRDLWKFSEEEFDEEKDAEDNEDDDYEDEDKILIGGRYIFANTRKGDCI